MYSIGKKHIQLFFSGEGIGESIGKWTTTVQKAGSDTIDKAVDTSKKGIHSIAQKSSELVNDAGALMFIESKLIQANGKAEVDKIVNEKKGELTPMQIETIYTLYEFGEIGINMVGKDTVRGGKKFFALKEVLKKSISEPHIMTFSNGEYMVTSISEYKSKIATTPESINVGVVKGFFNLHKKGSSRGFPSDTWENIATYCANRKWITNIIGGDKEIAIFLGAKYGEKVKKEEGVYNGILKEFIGKIDENILKKLLTDNKIEKTADGKIDIGKIIMGLEISNIKEIPKKLADKSEKLKENGIKLLKIAREEQKTLTIIKDLESLGQLNIIGTIKNKPFAGFTLDECNKYIPIIDEVLKRENEPKRKKEIEKIKEILIKLREGYMNLKDSGALAIQAKESDKLIKKNPNITLESVIRNAETSEIRKKESLAEDVSVTRANIEQGNNILQDMNIDISSFENLQKKYNELVEKEKNSGLTKEEERIKAQLYSQIQANVRAAQVVKNYEGFLSKEDIKEIFTQTNQFISGNPKETYNFQALEKIAVLTDPESTPTQRSLARLEAGQSVSMDDLLRGNSEVSVSSAPELSQVTVSKNSDGTFNIPLFAARNITKDQVNEYKEDTRLYAELGLSQLIPHIPLLTREFRNKGINTAIDGKTGTMEQQQILKSLYTQLFGKEIISSSLTEVERAFSNALGNPTNMKNAMQGVLSTHHLIAGSGQSIAPDTLQNWMRKNTQDNQKPTINLT